MNTNQNKPTNEISPQNLSHLEFSENDYWIAELIKSEIDQIENSTIHLMGNFDKNSILQKSAEQMISNIKSKMSKYVKLFNLIAIDNNVTPIKFFNIANTLHDFMLFRNSYKLIISLESDMSIVVDHNNSQATKVSNLDIIDNIIKITPVINNYDHVTWSVRGDALELEAFLIYIFKDFCRATVQ